jgi:hypothetical protein
MTRNEWACSAAAVAAGIAVIESSFTSLVPMKIDWDWFQSGGIALLCVACLALGFIAPRHPWRWGFLPIAAIPAWMLIRGGDLGNLWPVFLIAFIAFAIPPIIAAYVGAWARYWHMRR